MTAGEQADVRRRESRWLVSLTTLLCLAGGAMVLVTALARSDRAAQPWPPAVATPLGLAVLCAWILILATLAGMRALRLTHEGAHILRETRKRRELMARFDARAPELLGSDASDQAYDLVLNCALELVDGDTGSLMLTNVDEKELTIVAAQGLDEDVVRTCRIQFGDRIAGLVAETGRALLLGSGPAPAHLASRLERQHELSASICVPVLSEGMTIGVLSVNRLRGRPAFTANDLESLAHLALKAEGLLACFLPTPRCMVPVGSAT